jgi:alkylation response protein AidB-like acyl-CoA dehydrogenase
MGMRWYPQATLEFDNIVLPADRYLPKENFGQVMSIMNGTRPFCAAWGIGSARASLDYAYDWVRSNDRGYSSRRWERLQEDVAQMRATLDRVRRLVLRAGWTHDQGAANPTYAAMAKGYALPSVQEITFRSLQMMGPAGSSKEHLLEKWHRDTKFLDIVEGTGQLHRIAVARGEINKAAAAA